MSTTQSIAFLGRQPALGLAELESLYGADVLHPLNSGLVLIDKRYSEIEFERLGSSVKLGKVLTTIDSTDWKKVMAHMTKNIPEHLHYFPEGKIRLGLNAIGFRVSVRDLNRNGLELKKVIKNAGRSVRVVPNTEPELNSAQTLHNQLTGPTGLELAAIKNGDHTLLVQITNVQNIEAYAARDQRRPKRDSKVGMLPPKLAQTIINLSTPVANANVLDPFCGTGVVLQEALLMGFNAYGTDLEERMVEYSRENLAWLAQQYPERTSNNTYLLEAGDATNTTWQVFDAVACETYLGRPFAHEPDEKTLREVMQDADTIHKKFLKNMATQTKPGMRLCIAVPAWFVRGRAHHLKTLDSLEELGYTRMSFVHADNQDLVYHRINQVVGRELVVITRK